MKSQGTVKWFDQRKGFGFVTDQDGRDLFVHFTRVLAGNREKLTQGQAVCFETVPGEKGPMAVEVEALPPPPPA